VNWRIGFRSRWQDFGDKNGAIVELGVAPQHRSVATLMRFSFGMFAILLILLAAVLPLAGLGKDKLSYGEGLIVNVPMPESEVAQVVEDVAQNGVIRGTKEYNKDEFISGAKAATSSRIFPAWNEGGKVFYKVRMQAIDPRNF